jgi:transcriptional regulator with XRE-family HTH domain
MEIGRKLRALREEKHFSQGDIERRTGLLRCYTSRIENGFSIPNVETLEKLARALEIPLYRFFTDRKAVSVPRLPAVKRQSAGQINGKHRHELRLLAKAFKRLDGRNQRLLLGLAQMMATRDKKT